LTSFDLGLVMAIVLVPNGSMKDLTSVTTAAKSRTDVSTRGIFGVIDKVAAQFRKPNPSSESVFGDVTVNFSETTAHRKGQSVTLTTMEFKALKYMIQNPRRVISREKLLNEVWGYENYPWTRTVDNHILKLRHKLERELSRPVHFRTVRGTGYKFMP
jgi:DNA-binding response OmpR family regulator